MKRKTIYCKILLVLFTSAVLTCQAQQEHILTTSPTNITSAQAVINLPELNGNPQAILLAIPQGNTKALNQNPVGVWYYSGKWYVFNSNFAPMLIGLTYKIQYFLNEGPNEFLHLVTQANLAAGVSYIDHPALNDKPAVQFSIMQNHSPDIRGGSWRNPHEAKAVYNITTGRWYLKNINTQPLQKGCAYNIVIAGTSAPTTPVTPTNPTTPTNPANPPPTGTAIQTFFKSGSGIGGWVPHHLLSMIPELKHTITLTKKSRLVISAMMTFEPADCSFDCKGIQGYLGLSVDQVYSPGRIDAAAYFEVYFSGPPQQPASVVISDFMFDLGPGNHTVVFDLMNNSGFGIRANYLRQSSIIIIPLE